jgi:hypothetical protein
MTSTVNRNRGQGTARYLVETKQANYLFIVKDNQATLRQDIAELTLSAFPPEHTTTDKTHGRKACISFRLKVRLLVHTGLIGTRDST